MNNLLVYAHRRNFIITKGDRPHCKQYAKKIAPLRKYENLINKRSGERKKLITLSQDLLSMSSASRVSKRKKYTREKTERDCFSVDFISTREKEEKLH